MHQTILPLGLRAGKVMLAFSVLLIAVFFGLPAGHAATEANAKVPAASSYVAILKTAIMAIGGETTGITLSTGNAGVYELDLGGSATLMKEAEALNGQKVIVVGDLATKAGVEVKERRIIAVKSLHAAN